jgi:hypothetical protein
MALESGNPFLSRRDKKQVEVLEGLVFYDGKCQGRLISYSPEMIVFKDERSRKRQLKIGRPKPKGRQKEPPLFDRATMKFI